MNRKIKFRAWLKNEKRMVKVQDLIFNGTGVIGFQESNNDQNTDAKLHLLRDCLKSNEDSITDIKFNSLLGGYHFIMFELMQYTGIKDKNGVEIYEGDIIKIWGKTFDGKMKFDIGVIIYSEGMSCFGIKLKNTNIHLYQYMQNDYEFIGNIYENPELLEEK